MGRLVEQPAPAQYPHLPSTKRVRNRPLRNSQPKAPIRIGAAGNLRRFTRRTHRDSINNDPQSRNNGLTERFEGTLCSVLSAVTSLMSPKTLAPAAPAGTYSAQTYQSLSWIQAFQQTRDDSQGLAIGRYCTLEHSSYPSSE